MNKYEEAVEALKRTGSLSGAAAEIGVTRKTIKNRCLALKVDPNEFTMPNVMGRNSKKVRILPDGNNFYFATPTSGQINIRDIAISLSRIPWETGLTKKFLPLSEISVSFSEWVMEQTGDIKLSKLALFWYSPAAYIGCIPVDVDEQMTGNWKNIKQQTREAIYDHFGLFYYQSANNKKMKSLSKDFELIASDRKMENNFNPNVSSKYFISYWNCIKVIDDFIQKTNN